MRFKFIAIIALLVMMSGVIGIITQGADKNNEEEVIAGPTKYDAIYFTAKNDLTMGDLITKHDIEKHKIEYFSESKPEWLDKTVTADDLEDMLNNGATVARRMSAGETFQQDDISMLSAQLSEDYTIMPIAVLSSSLLNPDIPEKGFIDIYLLSNDNRVYRSNYFSSNDTGDKDYKDTRVKLFAEKVFYVKDFDRTSSSHMKISEKMADIKNVEVNSEASSRKSRYNSEDMSVIYGYFKQNDLERIIQAQMLGTFVASPGKVKNLRDGFSKIIDTSREVTPSDIVSGAPSPNDRNQILEIRGAK